MVEAEITNPDNVINPFLTNTLVQYLQVFDPPLYRQLSWAQLNPHKGPVKPKGHKETVIFKPATVILHINEAKLKL